MASNWIKISSVCALVFATSLVQATIHFKVTPNHADALYRCGEETTFSVLAVDDAKNAVTCGVVNATLDNFGPKKCGESSFDLAKQNPFQMKGTLQDPGFLRIVLSGKGCERLVWSVGYEPEKIVKGSPDPADFDEFWKQSRERLAREVPLDAQVERIAERSTKTFDFYRISFATFGRRVYGYMSVPTDKAKAPYAVNFQVAAAGFGGWTNCMWGRDDVINVFFAVYPFPPHWDWQKLGLMKKYDAMNAEAQAKYGTIYSQSGMCESREAYFFYPVILGIDRAIDWLAARPDVDKTRFRYEGTSQGGGFGFYLTGINHHFTKATFFVPAITDTMGYLKGRQSGWPSVVEAYMSNAERRVQAEKNAPYFDGANFAKRIKCPVRVAVGFSDTTCAPCAVYAAYNAIPVKDKGIVHGLGMTHSCFGKFYQELGAWLNK